MTAITGSATAMVIPAKAITDGGPTAEDCKKRGMYTVNVQAIDAESLHRSIYENPGSFGRNLAEAIGKPGISELAAELSWHALHP